MKKVFAILCAVLMLCTVLTVPAFAAETEKKEYIDDWIDNTREDVQSDQHLMDEQHPAVTRIEELLTAMMQAIPEEERLHYIGVSVEIARMCSAANPDTPAGWIYKFVTGYPAAAALMVALLVSALTAIGIAIKKKRGEAASKEVAEELRTKIIDAMTKTMSDISTRFTTVEDAIEVMKDTQQGAAQDRALVSQRNAEVLEYAEKAAKLEATLQTVVAGFGDILAAYETGFNEIISKSGLSKTIKDKLDAASADAHAAWNEAKAAMTDGKEG